MGRTKRTSKRRHRSTRKVNPKGGAIPPELTARRYGILFHLARNDMRIKNMTGALVDEPEEGWVTPKNDPFPMSFKNSINVLEENDGTYDVWYKYTVLKPGTSLFFRSKQQITELQDRSRSKKEGKHIGMWLDYASAVNAPAFARKNERTPSLITKRFIEYFGDWINEVKVLRPLKILHFPVDYTKVDPTNLHSYPSDYEGVIRDFCADRQNINNTGKIQELCADGYTLDFLYRAINTEALEGIGRAVKGYREICLLGVKEGDQVTLVSSTFDPVDPLPED